MPRMEVVHRGPSSIIIILIALALVWPTSAVLSSDSRAPVAPSEVERVSSVIRITHAGLEFDNTVGDCVLPDNLLAGGGDLYIVQFTGPVFTEWVQELRDLGARVHQYLDDYAYVVEMSETTKSKIEVLPNVGWIGEYHPAYKIHWTLLDKVGETKLAIFSFDDPFTLAHELQSYGTLVSIEEGHDKVILSTDASMIPEIARSSNVKEIYFQPEYQVLGNRAGIVEENHVLWDSARSGLPQIIAGQGIRVGIADTGWDTGNTATGHWDFTRGALGSRVAIAEGDTSPSSHGTHVAGVILGNGYCMETFLSNNGGSCSNMDRVYYDPVNPSANPYGPDTEGFAGVAPEATLEAHQPLGTSDWATMDANGCRIISNSWGGVGTPDASYNGDSSAADTRMWADDNIMIIFAIGREGPRSKTVNGGGLSWNGLGVNAVENFRPEKDSSSDDPNQLLEACARGPMNTGRIKPDICASGTHIISTRSYVSPGETSDVYPDNIIDEYTGGANAADYMYMTGTSVACPRIAGHLALINQYLEDIEGMMMPNRVLIKAILLNGAVDTGYGYPSYETGWGRVNIKNSLVPDAPRINQWAEGSLSTGQTWDFTTNGGANTYIESDRVPLKVMLCWDMPAGSAMSNDYELEVISPSGVIYKGNCFDQFGANDDWSHPDPDPLFWNTLGSPTASPPYGFDYDTDGDNDDDINNIEAVFVEKPEIGQWTVTVRSDSTPNSPNFAVAWGANTGPISNYHVELSTDVSTTMRSASGGTLAFPFEILNFGTLMDNIQFVEDADADLTVTYSEISPLGLSPDESKDVVALIILSPTAALGTHELTITGLSLNDTGSPPSQDIITLKVEVVDAGLPPTYQVTTNEMSQYGPSVVAFTDSGGTDHVIIAYASEEGVVNGNRVYCKHTTDDLTVGPGTWTKAQVSTQADMPGDIRITHHPSGTYQDRVYISWSGIDPNIFTDYRGSWTYCAWADPPYTSWNPVKVLDDTESPYYDTWRMTMTCTFGDLVWLLGETMEYTLAGMPCGVDTYGSFSNDGGVSWNPSVVVTPGDGNMYFFPNAFTDHNGNIVVYYYWRPPTGTERDLCYNYYNGTWSPKYSIWNNPDNSMFPVGTSTLEGPGNTNRLYNFFTYATTSNSPKDGYVLWADTSGGYPTNDADWNGPYPIHPDPAGSTISDADYGNRPILDIDATYESGNWYVWTEYLEEQANYNPYGVYNVHNCVSDDGYASMKELNSITASSYTKNHQVGDSLGAYKYETYNSYNGDLETGNMDIWLSVYHYDWQSDLDILGPATSMVAGIPNPCWQGQDLEITANIDDTTAGYSDIAAAEWCEGAAPSWPGTAMTAYDGLFDNPTEAVIGTALTITWLPGEYTIWVRGQDFFGNWGETTSATIDIIPGPCMPPWVDLTTPDGGEVWMGGTSQNIVWDMGDPIDNIADLIVDIYYSTDSGSTFPNTIVTGLTGLPSNPCTFAWDPVPSLDLSTVRIRVNVTDTCALFDSDESAADFTIDSTTPAPATNPHAELTAPNHVTIYWNASSSPDVDRYEVYYGMNNWDPSGDSYIFLANTGLSLNYQHNNIGITNPNSYFYQIRTFDVAGHEVRTTLQAAKTGSTQSTFANPTGWFLLGSALVQSDTSLSHVIQGQGLPGNYDYIQLYDAFDPVDPWKSHSIYRPASQNDLTDINYAQGFWIHLTSSTRYATAGYVSNMALPLMTGWNMVPYPFAQRTMTTADMITHLIANCPGFADVEILDPAAPYLLKIPDGTETMMHGSAFWIKVTFDTSWTVMNY